MVASVAAIWPLYLLGSAIVFVGFLALGAWVRGLTGRGRAQPAATLAASIVAFVLGAATIGVTIGIDQAQTAALNTRTLVYEVEVQINGTGPVRLLLPAPEDPGFLAVLNATNGSSSLRVVGPPGTSVQVIAVSDVRFDIRTQLQIGFLANTLTRISPFSAPDSVGRNVNATIDMGAGGGGTTTVDLDLRIQIIEYCGSTTFELRDTIREGTGTDPGKLTIMSTGC